MAAAVLGYILLFSEASVRTITPEQTLVIGEARVSVAIADTWQTREQGLGGTTELATDQGMLFIFDTDGQHSFWMRDMRYAIDIIWISAAKRVVYIEEGVSPDTFPQAFTPPTRARYVLEVPAGFAERHGIAIGSEVTF